MFNAASNKFNLGSSHLACVLGWLCTRRTSVGLSSCEAQLVGGRWLLQPLLRAGLTTGPDNHLLEVRLTLLSDPSLSRICLLALCSPRGGSFAVFHPPPAFVSFLTIYTFISVRFSLTQSPSPFTFIILSHCSFSRFPKFPLHPSYFFLFTFMFPSLPLSFSDLFSFTVFLLYN